MRAMVLDAAGQALRLDPQRTMPAAGPGQVLLRVHACGVCRTDLHVVDGELVHPHLPLVPGHEIVGTVAAVGPGVAGIGIGQRLGVPWLGWSCGVCGYCRGGRENLCERARFTGYDLDGGYADYTVADARFCFPIPPQFSDVEAAPLLCAGLIGYRAWRLAGEAKRLGLYGFGAAAHIAVQVARHYGQEVYAFTRPGDAAGQAFARAQGAHWAGDAGQPAPEALDAALIFAPAGELVPAALAATARGGTVVCAGIHMSDIPAFPYRLLWEERVLRSVANLTRADGEAFMALAAAIPIRTTTTAFPLEQANEALAQLRGGRLHGAAVLCP
ncbi:zinc-dependent alcohol dehydrogenase family protein [Frateuria defendens]|uniref:zinc-dependent alcohol dehydrogenase family protein n=1 Tax=Frateuria defendens TaxID=2219559 RepID=UPI00066FC49D|nr:zinc-dependent alcohol dehydrogenase family protein [Frateuria defendens]